MLRTNLETRTKFNNRKALYTTTYLASRDIKISLNGIAATPDVASGLSICTALVIWKNTINTKSVVATKTQHGEHFPVLK